MTAVVSLLDRPVYLYSEIDHIVGLPGGTARRWINGYTRAGVAYDPIVRLEPEDKEWATWGEFVETRILAEYRDRKIRTVRLRAAVNNLRQYFDLRYPLAHFQPFLLARDGDLHLENRAVTDDDDETLTALKDGQMLLADMKSQSVIDTAVPQAEADGQLVLSELAPDLRFPGVVVNPTRQGGKPTLVGRRVSVDIIAAQALAGEPPAALASDFGISIDQVRAAVAFSNRAA